MGILMYLPRDAEDRERVREAIGQAVPEQRTETCPTIEALAERLRDPLDASDIIVLLAETQDHLAELSGVGDLLDGVRDVVLLPCGDDEAIALGHRLHPRVLLHGADWPERLSCIVRKMQDDDPGRTT